MVGVLAVFLFFAFSPFLAGSLHKSTELTVSDIFAQSSEEGILTSDRVQCQQSDRSVKDSLGSLIAVKLPLPFPPSPVRFLEPPLEIVNQAICGQAARERAPPLIG